MIDFIQPYIGITLKLVTGMIGILAFLRITGKAQMAQLTPLDTVSAFVIGALVGGVLYNPDMSIWHILFALAVWTGFNMLVRFAMRSARLRHIIKGESVFLVKDGVINFKNFKREFVSSGLKQSGRSQAWALRVIKKNGFNGPGELFCMEWTPGTGIYFVTYDGHVKRGVVEVDAQKIEPDNAQV